jgi:uncharacterized protein (TIGR02466 family)
MSNPVAIFQTLLYCKDLEDFKLLNPQYATRVQELKQEFATDQANWICNTFTTLNSYDLKLDSLFQPLISAITQEVMQFGASYGIIGKSITCTDAWANIAGPSDYQEFHSHPNNHFSIAYYVQVPESSGDIHFKSTEAFFDNCPLPCREDSMFPASAHQIRVPANEGMLVAFRSNLQHMVSQNLSNKDRISISMNFKYLA